MHTHTHTHTHTHMHTQTQKHPGHLSVQITAFIEWPLMTWLIVGLPSFHIQPDNQILFLSLIKSQHYLSSNPRPGNIPSLITWNPCQCWVQYSSFSCLLFSIYSPQTKNVLLFLPLLVFLNQVLSSTKGKTCVYNYTVLTFMYTCTHMHTLSKSVSLDKAGFVCSKCWVFQILGEALEGQIWR
jgi:hypothetical protein